ncbi:MAG: hypothetical protein PHR28_02360 [candidate division Zixibacteria bacterium]|nr:hypothetical protein [candidate division Zixibacteria bacterium]
MIAFSDADAARVVAVLNADKYVFQDDHYRIRLENREEKRLLTLEIYPRILLGDREGMLVVVYTASAHLQLHHCSGYVCSEELGEVTFVAETDGTLSGIVVEQGAACSLYAGIDRRLISSDFTKLGVEVMLSGVALSLAEEIISPPKEDREKPS